MKDQFGREINYMRISITDRCNLRCIYCMPEGIPQIPAQEILTYEEILEVCRAALNCGITRFKITGGEPLVRSDASWLIGQMTKLPGTEQVTMTTNGVLLEEHLEKLSEAGLSAVNISLDTLNRERFREITGADRLPEVLHAVRAAFGAGFRVKINCVPQKGLNEDEVIDLVHLARELPIDVRFIEMMPIGTGRNFQAIDNGDLLKQIRRRYPGLSEDPSVHGNGPAVYYRIPGFAGSIGMISAVHGRFCSSCNRIRMTSEGKLKSCLADGNTIDVRTVLRNVQNDDMRRWMLEKAVREAVLQKPERHFFEYVNGVTEQKLMAGIGG